MIAQMVKLVDTLLWGG